jgi:mannose-6-phosphate isomerase-like protein (cupin superfamily)
MIKQGTNYSSGRWLASAKMDKVFMGNDLGLTGSELSMGFLARGSGQPFVHSHKRNEEIYIVVSGHGLIHVDGEEWPLEPGAVVRVAAAGKRALRAAADSDLVFYCLQAETGSLKQATAGDGVVEEAAASWLGQGGAGA